MPIIVQMYWFWQPSFYWIVNVLLIVTCVSVWGPVMTGYKWVVPPSLSAPSIRCQSRSHRGEASARPGPGHQSTLLRSLAKCLLRDLWPLIFQSFTLREWTHRSKLFMGYWNLYYQNKLISVSLLFNIWVLSGDKSFFPALLLLTFYET